MGGKKTANTARKTSELHMAPEGGEYALSTAGRGRGVQIRIEDQGEAYRLMSMCRNRSGRVSLCDAYHRRMAAWDRMTLIT